jgi:hypothetical protein
MRAENLGKRERGLGLQGPRTDYKDYLPKFQLIPLG